jgi:hypothetical protein
MNRVSVTATTAVRLHFSFVRLFTCAATACLFLACELAHAQVTPTNWYRMAESDGTTVAVQPLAATIDMIGGKTSTLTGALVQTDIGATAISSVGSSRSLVFTGSSGDGGNSPLLSTVVDNFGLEAWVKPLGTSGSDQVIAYNGNFGFNGWGIVLKSDGTYQGQFGIATFGSVPATIGTWAHVAIVRDNGNATLYVNGVASGGSTTLPPGTPSTRFGVANGPPAFVTGLHGLVDEVRAFTFPAGNFLPNMLLFSAKRVTSTADSGVGSLRDQLIAAPAGGTVVITATGTISLLGPLAIVDKGVNLFGPGAANLSVSGANLTRVFFIDSPSPVMIGDLTIASGAAKGGAGGGGTNGGGGGMGAGGGIFANAGDVVLTRVNFASNAATGGKGGNTSGTGCTCMAGGGGLGGAGGTPTGTQSSGGGGGWLGAGGGSSITSGAGGGAGIIANGGAGGSLSGGGGGAYTNGLNGGTNTGGNGADGLGGKGGSDHSGSHGIADGGDGLAFGGGGGAGDFGDGGNGGRYAGGGGGNVGAGGAGGDFGGGGGGFLLDASAGGPGGFGGGSGGQRDIPAGSGGFGGGSGGSSTSGGAAGAFAGHGGVTVNGAGGGGGAALGGAIFLRADYGATLTWNDGLADTGSVTGGAAGSGGGAIAGSGAGSALFLLGGTTTLNVSSGTQTITGTIAGWSNEPPNLTKTGTGVLVLAGGGSNLGVITASKGDLRVNFNMLNLAAGKELDVNNGGTLSGVLGTINGPVKLASGGTISPGDPTNAAGVGTLGIGDFTWNGGGAVAFQLASTSGIASDALTVTGNLTKQGSGFAFHFTDGSDAPICGTTYTLIQYTGTTNFSAADFAFTYSGASAVAASSTFAIDGATRKVLFTANCSNNQTITNFVSTPANPVYSNGGTFSITAIPGGSTGALTFGSNTPAVCSLSGSIVTMNTRGVCQLTANQAGDSNYNPAPTVMMTLHFEQLTVNATASSGSGTIGPSSQVVDYNATATFTVVPQPGFTAVVTGNTCTISHTSGNTWTSGAITSDCNITADFIDRVFFDGFE